MKNWLRYWLLKRRAQREGLFLYWDGLRWRLADPVQVVRRMMAQEVQEETFSALEGLERVFSDFGEQAIQKAAELFEVHRFDGSRGLTDLQVLKLLQNFVQWLAGQKKSGIPGFDWQLSTEAASFSTETAPG